MIQEQIKQRHIIDNSDKIRNWLNLSKSAILSKNYSESKRYADRAIAEESNNPQAWFLKMCCALALESPMDEAIFCSEECAGISGEYLSQNKIVLLESLLHRYTKPEIEKIDEKERKKTWYLGSLIEYQEKTYKMFYNLVAERADEGKSNFLTEFVIALLDSIPSMSTGILKTASVHIAMAGFRLYGIAERKAYIPERLVIATMEKMAVSAKNARKTSDTAVFWAVLNNLIDIEFGMGYILEFYKKSCTGYSEDENLAAWKYLSEHPDLQVNLQNRVSEDLKNYVAASDKIIGGAKMRQQAEFNLRKSLDEFHRPQKYY